MGGGEYGRVRENVSTGGRNMVVCEYWREEDGSGWACACSGEGEGDGTAYLNHALFGILVSLGMCVFYGGCSCARRLQ